MLYFGLLISISLISVDSTAEIPMEKEIRYKKETTIDLSGSSVSGEKQAPPAFFITKKDAPNAARLLDERLKFKLLHYNDLGF